MGVDDPRDNNEQGSPFDKLDGSIPEAKPDFTNQISGDATPNYENGVPGDRSLLDGNVEAVVYITDTVGNLIDDCLGDVAVAIGDVVCLIYQKMGLPCPYNYVTGIADSKKKVLDISIYPNPAQHSFYIDVNDQIVNIELKDLLGRTIYEQNGITGKIAIDCHSFPEGVYIISARNDRSSTTKKIIIVR